MNIDEMIIKRITLLMDSQGLNQRKLAAKAKINYHNLNRLLNQGRSIVKSDILPDIAKALGVTKDFLENPIQGTTQELLPRNTIIDSLNAILPTLTEDELQTLLGLASRFAKK